MEGEWFESVLKPRLAALQPALEGVGTPGWDPEPSRVLVADINDQIHSAAATGTITAQEQIEAAHLVAEVVRAHGGVATERRTVNIPTTVTVRGPFGRTRQVPVEKLGPRRRQDLYAALVAQLNQSAAAGLMSQDQAAETAARARQQYGLA